MVTVQDLETFHFRTSWRWFWLIAGLGLAMAAYLAHLGLWGLSVIPPQMNEPDLRFTVGYVPLGLAAALLLGLVPLARLRGAREWELVRSGLKMHRSRGTYVFRWEQVRIFVSRGGRVLDSALISDGHRNTRVYRLFLPGYDRFCRLVVDKARQVAARQGTVDLDA